MSSRYCRHEEYPPYALVTNASARSTPSSRIWPTVSASMGCQLRLPQYTGRSVPRSISRSRARHCWLIGDTPPKCW
jgi:hypothetical protein